MRKVRLERKEWIAVCVLLLIVLSGLIFFVKNKKSDENKKGFIYKEHAIDLPIDQEGWEKSFSYYNERVCQIEELLLERQKENIYYCPVPDKYYYYCQEVGKTDFRWNDAGKGFLFANTIDITKQLTLDAYYQTDPHWRQEREAEAAEKILLEMNVGGNIGQDIIKKEKNKEFAGIQKEEYGMPNNEAFFYVWNPKWEQSSIRKLQNGSWEALSFYDEKEEETTISYDFFTSGAAPVLEVTNPQANTDRTLVLFRDSYADSMLFWFMDSYKKIIVIDTRFVSLSAVKEMKLIPENEKMDVLFLYSESLMQKSYTMKSF